ncbi:phage holin family protein [Sedimentitalea todarodis]|uniref:Phage holin family protein n=1 Tax=Sedimentitalea todarodis TaxID=1631240 RepID=A0ABU3VI18_9RHOB|nr:phage holin family protein [Sedimentitalea todarodis]MDU9005799.1 phage holin family protein [Sedimentitalea todarodis]
MLAEQLKKAAARAALKTAMLSGGAVCVLVGIGFLTMALWMYLTVLYGAILASLIVGMAYLGVGLIVMGFSVAKPTHEPAANAKPRPDEAPMDTSDAPPLVQAFLYGMQAGMKARRS